MAQNEYLFNHIPTTEELEQSMREQIFMNEDSHVHGLCEPLSRPQIDFAAIASKAAIAQLFSACVGIVLYLMNGRKKKWFTLSFLTANGVLCSVYRKKIVLFLIKLYQYSAPEHIRRKCRFQPSCSAFAAEAIDKYGLMGGGILSLKRFSRCKVPNGGYDPVP